MLDMWRVVPRGAVRASLDPHHAILLAVRRGFPAHEHGDAGAPSPLAQENGSAFGTADASRREETVRKLHCVLKLNLCSNIHTIEPILIINGFEIFIHYSIPFMC